ncbi:MAG: DedA family protein [Sphingomonas sp.]|uniref:DedA family protein n=1 Tax=unclassified Sphingomonas TaxID=196159 RepID=UPI002456CC6C|nr:MULTISPECIES: DedA family protein [unclassified Sphingomonas]MBQ1498523.1 DedA family protein [Sphingomonas sp.]MDH4744803.1 DedA family protein [Sphingomonas sp. CBMAI 2297]
MWDAASWGYWGIFWLMVLENVIPPIPSEAIMSVAGIAVARGKMSLPLVLFAGTAGTVLGNLFWWEIGRRLGYKRLRPLVDRWGRWLTLDWHEIEKLKTYFDKWGGPTVLIFRFMPVGRTVISIPAGLMHMPFWRFVGYTAVGSAIWNVILLGGGYALGATIEDIEDWVGPTIIAIVAGIALLYVWRILTWKPRD